MNGILMSDLIYNISYPKVRKEVIVEDFHGTKVNDPYRWMENANNPELIEWTKKQNELVDQFIDHNKRKLYQEELTKLFDYTRYSVPEKRGEYYYYQKNDGLQPQYLIYRRKGLEGQEELIFDPNTLSEDGTTAVVGTSFSESAKYCAMSISVHGSDWQEIWVYNLDTKNFEDKLENIRNYAGINWLKDDSAFFYSAMVGKDESQGGQKLWFHKLGDDQKADQMIYEHPDDEEMRAFSFLDQNQDYIFVHLARDTMPRNLLYYKKYADIEFKPIVDDFKYAYQVLDVVDDVAYIKTNENADNSKIIAIDLNNPDKSNWKDIIQESDPIGFSVGMIDNHIYIVYSKDVKHILSIFDLQGNKIRDVKFPTFGTIYCFGKVNKKELFVMFSSFLHPVTQYVYRLQNDELITFAKPNYPIDVTEFEINQVFYKSLDSTEIPMYIMSKKGIELNGNHPTLLYGYGGFGVSQNPEVSQVAIMWIKLGGVYAVPNLRGGGEYGEKWHKSGILEKKQNVFDDFITAAQYLIDKKYTNPKKLAIRGGSNGGLLTAAVMLQKPDLFGAVITAVGVLDMLRYHKYSIGRYWVPEYGDPSNPEHFDFLMKYSPLHNVKPIEYPPTYVYSADTDDRVDPAHSKKYVATLQDIGKGGPLFLRIIIKAGHGMGKPVTKQIEDLSYEFAFLSGVLDF
jgi:prolyl oligopeptidase